MYIYIYKYKGPLCCSDKHLHQLQSLQLLLASDNYDDDDGQEDNDDDYDDKHYHHHHLRSLHLITSTRVV